jgi:citrate synthase
MASAANVLGDVHGGAGEQALTLFGAIAERLDRDISMAVAVELRYLGGRGYVPGFGHRFHPVDRRSAPPLALTEDTAAAGVVGGRFGLIARAVEGQIAALKGKRIPSTSMGGDGCRLRRTGVPA